MRCVAAAKRHDDKRYNDSLFRAYKTLTYLRRAHRPEAYEEGLLLIRALEYARSGKTLDAFSVHLNRHISSLAA